MSLSGGNAAGLWPTPRSEDSESAGNHPNATDSLTGATGMWPTASAHDGRRPGADVHSTQGANLNWEAALWTTPTVQDSGKATKRLREDHQNNLTADVEAWATPTSRDWKGSYSDEAMVRKDGKSRMDQVESQAIHLIDYSLLSRQAPRTLLDGEPSSPNAPTSRRQLNPAFVEWLMGWPEGWTSLVPRGSGSPETESCHWRRHMRSELSRLGWTVPDDNC